MTGNRIEVACLMYLKSRLSTRSHRSKSPRLYQMIPARDLRMAGAATRQARGVGRKALEAVSAGLCHRGSCPAGELS